MTKKKKKPKKKISPFPSSSSSKKDVNMDTDTVGDKEEPKEVEALKELKDPKKKKDKKKKKKKRRSSIEANCTTTDIRTDEKVQSTSIDLGSGSAASPSSFASLSLLSQPPSAPNTVGSAASPSSSSSLPTQPPSSPLQPPLPPPPNVVPVPKPVILQQEQHHPQPLSNFSSWGEAFQAAASVTPQDLGDDYIDRSFYGGDIGKSDKVPWGSGNVKGVSEIAMACLHSNDNDDDDRDHVHDQSSKKKRPLEHEGGNNDHGRDEDLHDEKESTSSTPQPPKKKKKKSKKTKKDKKKDAEKLLDDNHSDGVETDDGENTHPPPLEGQMIDHNNETIMILLDRKNKIVYSATQRTVVDDDDSPNDRSDHLVPIGLLDDENNIRITADIPAANSDADAQMGTKGDELDFPFSVDPDDHCESPLNAYQDIQPILDTLTNILGIETRDQLSIYDPYFCNGSVVQNLKELGYTNVYNKREDCYLTWSDTTEKASNHEHQQVYPKYDVFMTNPPYSGDHIEKMINHLTKDERTKGKPWCLLMPTYVHKKDYYKERVASKKNPKKGDQSKVQPFYLVPKKRYVYLPPPNFREKKLSDVHRKSSPFVSMWFVWGGTKERTELLIKGYKEWEKKNKRTCDLARGKSALRDLRRKLK